MIKNNLVYICAALLITLTFACNKSKDNDLLRANDWKVTELKLSNPDTTISVNSEYILSFDTNRTYRFHLDVNTCGGNYTLSKRDQIKFEEGACTEACCDSELAIDIFNKINDSDRYNLSGDNLILSSECCAVTFIKI